MTTVARKKGTQTLEATHMQTHMDSIHSPQSTRKTIMKLCMKSTKFHRGIIFLGSLSTLSEEKCSTHQWCERGMTVSEKWQTENLCTVGKLSLLRTVQLRITLPPKLASR